MRLTVPRFQARLAGNATLCTLVAGLAAFGTYSSMYAFRKGFAAGSYAGSLWGMDYKVWLVLAQVIGYMLSKFAGIRIVSGLKLGNRAQSILLFIGISWIALLLFAIVPRPYSIFCLFLNGLPLGMIWGIVFSYLEGRRSTELTGTIMAVSLIFSSGVAKTTGKWMLLHTGIAERWMPFGVGLLFVVPLLIFVFLLEQLPPPGPADIAHRAPRLPMTAADRRRFIGDYFPGIALTVVLYLMLTAVRDMRDNFEVEIWSALGYGAQPAIFTRTDIPIALCVLVIMGLLMLVKNNLRAFTLIHVMVLAGCVAAGLSTILYDGGHIGPVAWMSVAGLGLYMAYIPYNAIFFERMIATFRITGNVGFIMYVADSCGYLGTLGVLLTKQFGDAHGSWLHSFHTGILTVASLGGAMAVLSLIYFRLRYLRGRPAVSSTISNTVYA